MQVHPLVDEGLGNSTYVVELGDGGALVVDPQRDTRPYLRLLSDRGLAARFAIETHLHADFISGGRELQAKGAHLLAPAGSQLGFADRSLRDGDEVDVGGLALRAVATPGHTPEHLGYLLQDGSEPLALFSGGTLLAGGVARTDLLSPDQTEPLARAAYRSIQQLLSTLPDELPVYPTHGGGSFCSATPGTERTTTIGRERTSNPLLAGDADEDTFVTRLLAGLGSYPPYFLALRAINRAGAAVLGSTPPPLRPLTVDQVEAAARNGAQLVDVRSFAAFAAGHVPGALSNTWRAQFATWLGWLVSRTTPIVFIADDGVDRDDLAWAARTIGFDHLAGELAGGVAAWQAAGREVATTLLVAAAAVEGRRIVDVRQRSEYVAGHAPGAIHVELGSLPAAADAVPAGPVAVHCGHGERAMTAASLLQRAGHRDVAVLPGGPGQLGALQREGQR
jgi:hydroxyacylglutathione hydrolase